MLPPQPPRAPSIRGLRLYFRELEPWVARSASLPFVRFICGRIWCCGVLPAALPTPLSATLSPALPVYLRECGAAGSASGQTACPVRPTLHHSVPPRPRESSPPQCLSPPLLQVWMYVSFLSTWCWTSLPFDFLSVLVVRGGAVCLPTPSWFLPAFSCC